MPGKLRLDILLVEKGLFPSREKAKTSIMAGVIRVNGKLVDKPGADVPADAAVEVIKPAVPYVSRGGLKLEKAIKRFGFDLRGKVMVDIGASTGGFTDCALQHGAARVYAVDVGYGQLDWKLRQDDRVINLEKTNIRYLEPAKIKEAPDLITADVSFISLEKVLPKITEILPDGGLLITLIKPQFEAGREKVGKKGVVREPGTHAEVIHKVINAAGRLGFKTTGLTYSPIKGPEGNIEYLACMIKTGAEPVAYHQDLDIGSIVKEAFSTLV